MPLGTILVIIAALLVIIGIAVGFMGSETHPARYRRPFLILAIAVLLVCTALCIGVEPFIRT